MCVNFFFFSVSFSYVLTRRRRRFRLVARASYDFFMLWSLVVIQRNALEVSLDNLQIYSSNLHWYVTCHWREYRECASCTHLTDQIIKYQIISLDLSRILWHRFRKIWKSFCLATGGKRNCYACVGTGTDIMQAPLKLPIRLLVWHSLYLLPACTPGIFSFSLNCSRSPLSASLPIPFCVDRFLVHRCVSSPSFQPPRSQRSGKMNCKLPARNVLQLFFYAFPLSAPPFSLPSPPWWRWPGISADFVKIRAGVLIRARTSVGVQVSSLLVLRERTRCR